MPEAALKKLAERALALAKQRKVDAIVELSHALAGNTRFAKNAITSAGDVERVSLAITVQRGQRRATARTNQLDDRSLDDVIERAARLAALAPENAEAMPPLPAQRIAPVKGAIDASTLALSAKTRADAVAAMLARRDGLELAGFYEHGAHARAIATTAGLWAHHAWTSCALSCTARTADGTGSGWAGQSSHRAGALDAPGLARVAVTKANESAKPRRLEPGRYTVVLEPAAVGSLLGFLVGALDARRAHEGRSFFSKPGGATKVGDKLFPESITVRADPNDAELCAAPFDGEGLPREPRAWIDRGTLTALPYSRFWAKKHDTKPTARPDGWSLAGTQVSDRALVADVGRGVLITRFWYLRDVDPQALLVTGLTRDGTFLIENGAVVGPVNNFRFNESPVQMLARCDAIGHPVIPGGGEGGGLRVPALRTHEFNLASISDAV
jgi:predicted Zn-dependent protease